MTASELDRRQYVRAVLDMYLVLPQAPARARRSDRELAAALHSQGIPFQIVRVALLLATARRLQRPMPLPPVRSLHYFLPAIEEVRQLIPSPSYVHYLELKIRSFRDNAGAP